jgi:alpha-tubulin suppressor-like RCC1 family protein
MASLATAASALAAPALPAEAAFAQAAASSPGSLRAWGAGAHGELGDGTRGSRDAPVSVRLPAGTKVTAVRGGCTFGLAATAAGSVLTWGRQFAPTGGPAITGGPLTPVQVRLPKGTRVSTVRAGCSLSLALTTKGGVLAWGSGRNGELGNGSTRNHIRPVRVALPRGTRVKAISAGGGYGLALTTTGHVLAWGGNFDGQLGDGTTADRHRPVRVKLPAGARVSAIAAGGGSSFAVTSAGLFAWGANEQGQLGDGSTTNQHKPERITLPPSVQSAGRVTQLASGCQFTVALTARGQVLAWGTNFRGQLGDGTMTDSHVAVKAKLPHGTRVTSISAGCAHALALTGAGRVLSWGLNADGELGNATMTDSDKPVRVHLAAGLRATAIGAGPVSLSSYAIVSRR